MLSGKVIKVIGFAASIAGMGLSLVTGWAEDKQMKEEVAEQVAKAVAKVKDD